MSGNDETTVLSLNEDADWTKLLLSIGGDGLPSRAAANIVEKLRELGAKSALVENDYLDRDYSDEFSAFYSKLFQRYRRHTRRLHFFRADIAEVSTRSSLTGAMSAMETAVADDDYLGFVVFRPVLDAPVGRAVLRHIPAPAGLTPSLQVRADYQTHPLGVPLPVQGMQFTQQDRRISACAQASIWMSGRHFHAKHGGPWFSTSDITEAASKPTDFLLSQSLPAGSSGLGVNNMLRALRDVSKAGGGVRTITAPDNRLKMIQRSILDLLHPFYQPRRPVHGFVDDRSVLSNAEAHLKRRFILNIDLKDFFPSITEPGVSGLLRSLGLTGRVADVVARLTCVDGHLPQGAPTSPLLSNMICFGLDKRLMAFARDARCIYTRYADDITFSGVQPPIPLFEGGAPPAGRVSVDQLAESLRRIVDGNGLTLHPDKLHYADRNSRRTVTGIKINEFPNVDRRYVRDLRAALHRVATLGVDEAQTAFEAKHGGSVGVALASHLQGRIAWLTFVKGRADPVVRALTTRYNACFPERPLRVEPTSAQKRDRSVWVVDNDNAIVQGSAFFVDGVGLVTAAHCVRDATEVEIYHPSKAANKFAARVLRTCQNRDLALLEHDLPATEFFELRRRTAPVVQGDHVSAVGYPGYGPGGIVMWVVKCVADHSSTDAEQTMLEYMDVGNRGWASGLSGTWLSSSHRRMFKTWITPKTLYASRRTGARLSSSARCETLTPTPHQFA